MMLDIVRHATDPQFLLMIFSAIAAAATVLTLAMPLFQADTLEKRMRAVATERERMRARERERMNKAEQKVVLRQAPKLYMKRIVEQFSLDKWLGTADARRRLMQAGFRGPQTEVSFLFFRLVTPIVLFLFAVFYVFVVLNLGYSLPVKIGICILAAYLGIKGPEIYLSNITQRRQASMKVAFPDALDLLLICVEAGMSIELAFRKVSQQIGTQSVPLAEELTLTTAELSYLPDRRQAYENLVNRTGLDAIKSVCTALIQAEKYGTPLGQTLRVLARESRDVRMNEAEKKAAALPPKLTVPMILFFLPVIFIVILTPSAIQIFKWP